MHETTIALFNKRSQIFAVETREGKIGLLTGKEGREQEVLIEIFKIGEEETVEFKYVPEEVLGEMKERLPKGLALFYYSGPPREYSAINGAVGFVNTELLVQSREVDPSMREILERLERRTIDDFVRVAQGERACRVFPDVEIEIYEN